MKTTNPVFKLGLALHVIGKPRPHLVQHDAATEGVAAVTTPPPVKMKFPFVLDVSSWDLITYAAVNPKPTLVYARATYGAGYKDPLFVKHVNGFRMIDVPITAYHFFLYNEDVRAQVDNFKAQIAAIGGAGVLSYPVVLDIEGNPGTGAVNASSLLWQWVDAINRELGIGVWIYSSANYLNYLRTNGALPSWLVGNDAKTQQPRRFAIAGYPTYPNDVATMPAGYWPIGLPQVGRKWLWQYTDALHVQGIQGSQDGNQELEHIDPGNQIPPTQPPVTSSGGITFVVNVDTLNVRSAPGTSGAIIGHMSKGAKVVAQNVGGTDAWVQVDYNGTPGWMAVQTGSTVYMVKG